jgi:hypothetical protein
MSSFNCSCNVKTGEEKVSCKVHMAAVTGVCYKVSNVLVTVEMIVTDKHVIYYILADKHIIDYGQIQALAIVTDTGIGYCNRYRHWLL